MNILMLIFLISPSVFLLISTIMNRYDTSGAYLLSALIFGALIIIVGISGLIYLFTSKDMKKKLTTVSVSSIVWITILVAHPIVVKAIDKNYINSNKKVLEQVAESLLDGQMSLKEANSYLDKNGIEVRAHIIIQERQVVTFLIHGMMDNCIGISYSKKGLEGELCGGRVDHWENIMGNWYQIGSI